MELFMGRIPTLVESKVAAGREQTGTESL